MKRYDEVPKDCCHAMSSCMMERSDGDWVLWEDAQKEITRLREALQQQADDWDTWRDTFVRIGRPDVPEEQIEFINEALEEQE